MGERVPKPSPEAGAEDTGDVSPDDPVDPGGDAPEDPHEGSGEEPQPDEGQGGRKALPREKSIEEQREEFQRGLEDDDPSEHQGPKGRPRKLTDPYRHFG